MASGVFYVAPHSGVGYQRRPHTLGAGAGRDGHGDADAARGRFRPKAAPARWPTGPSLRRSQSALPCVCGPREYGMVGLGRSTPTGWQYCFAQTITYAVVNTIPQGNRIAVGDWTPPGVPTSLMRRHRGAGMVHSQPMVRPLLLRESTHYEPNNRMYQTIIPIGDGPGMRFLPVAGRWYTRLRPRRTSCAGQSMRPTTRSAAGSRLRASVGRTSSRPIRASKVRRPCLARPRTCGICRCRLVGHAVQSSLQLRRHHRFSAVDRRGRVARTGEELG